MSSHRGGCMQAIGHLLISWFSQWLLRLGLPMLVMVFSSLACVEEIGCKPVVCLAL
ncbi:MAG TPA: hypothetical protein PK156_33370 [Polyangium sp.]|nr:hypothetical protein [Polyangium sp.]